MGHWWPAEEVLLGINQKGMISFEFSKFERLLVLTATLSL